MKPATGAALVAAMAILLTVLALSGCSATTVDVPLADGRMARLTSYRLFIATAAKIDVTDPATGAVVSGSYSSDPQAQMAADALTVALRALQLSAPGSLP